MTCPICHINLQKLLFNNVEVDYCPRCLGMWFEEDELRWVKDVRDENLSWLDIDLWQKEEEFHISPGQKLCPYCRLPLYEVAYGDSKIRVDVCNICHGIWLDKLEFAKIMNYLKEKADIEILHRFIKNSVQEFLEIFAGPESIREEIGDFITLLKLFAYKFTAQHPLMAQLISKWPK